MADLLEQGASWLDDQRHAHMARTVVYGRDAAQVELSATIGRTEFEQADEAGLIHRIESRDFLVRAADLDLGDGPTLPKTGDRVREVLGSRVFVYEVNAPGGQPPWRFSDPYRKALRIHTKHIGTEDA
ncbi:MAG: hypothetical protein DYG94_06405 [Leptolyngbya sp. PLA3]|nr:MAG: hypothetical protein EDM82_05685 [Cyanobacteria bacterium CYA]MCE7968361.1 hypothetical protein [Leptolyngbya sp. PL-A3]